jgi:hypothetical protein
MTIALREDFDAFQARTHASRSDDGNQARRLLSIAAVCLSRTLGIAVTQHVGVLAYRRPPAPRGTSPRGAGGFQKTFPARWRRR